MDFANDHCAFNLEKHRTILRPAITAVCRNGGSDMRAIEPIRITAGNLRLTADITICAGRTERLADGRTL